MVDAADCVGVQGAGVLRSVLTSRISFSRWVVFWHELMLPFSKVSSKLSLFGVDIDGMQKGRWMILSRYCSAFICTRLNGAVAAGDENTSVPQRQATRGAKKETIFAAITRSTLCK